MIQVKKQSLMAILKILTAPNALLKQKSLSVNEVDDSIRQIMADMLETMYADNGVGLAAPQIGILKRIIVIDLADDDDSDRSKEFYPLYMANPEVLTNSDNKVTANEGCLSLPGQSVPVARFAEIEVKYLNYHNKLISMKVDGWLCRAILHEIDHLDGKLLIDYLTPLKRSMAINKLKKLQAHHPL